MLDKKKYNFNDPLDVGIFYSIMLSRGFLSITDEFKYKKTRYIELSEIYCKDLLYLKMKIRLLRRKEFNSFFM